jgi:REP element-mobilizing transposase RayT
MEYKHLHHVDLPNHYQFITFRTHDSIDPYLLKILSKQVPENIKQQEADNYLDKSNKGAYLNKDNLNFLYKFFIKNNDQLYKLKAFCIMPNHVHLLIKPLLSLNIVVKKIKGSSAFEINKIRGTSGNFWSEYYFDKLIRDEKHFNVVYNYIKNNPKKISQLKDELPRFYGVYE